MFALFNLPPRRTWQAGVLAALLLVACRLGAAAAGGEPLAPAVRELVIPVAVLLLMAWTTRRHALTRAQLRERRTALAEAAGRLQALVNCDALTGLPNRAALQQRLDALCASPAAADQPWCLALIDLDHFKQVNDQAGHAAGDEVLCRFAALAGGLLRADDVLARWGGEEFLLLLPAADAAAATHGVERLRERLAQQPLLPTRPTLRVTLSAGVAEHRAGDSWASTLAQADVALYAAKAGGRNRVRLAQGWPAL
jgi:diguanylate cyclase (GGDEF)-like protein